LREGDISAAREAFELSIRKFQKTNSLIGVVYAIEGLASLHVAQQQFSRAACLFAWADAVREQIKDTRPQIEQDWVDRDMAVLRSQLDPTTFENTTIMGRTMTIDQTIVLALES
jgi:hypothetical protein